MAVGERENAFKHDHISTIHCPLNRRGLEREGECDGEGESVVVRGECGGDGESVMVMVMVRGRVWWCWGECGGDEESVMVMGRVRQ